MKSIALLSAAIVIAALVNESHAIGWRRGGWDYQTPAPQRQADPQTLRAHVPTLPEDGGKFYLTVLTGNIPEARAVLGLDGVDPTVAYFQSQVHTQYYTPASKDFPMAWRVATQGDQWPLVVLTDAKGKVVFKASGDNFYRLTPLGFLQGVNQQLAHYQPAVAVPAKVDEPRVAVAGELPSRQVASNDYEKYERSARAARRSGPAQPGGYAEADTAQPGGYAESSRLRPELCPPPLPPNPHIHVGPFDRHVPDTGLHVGPSRSPNPLAVGIGIAASVVVLGGALVLWGKSRG